MLKPMYTVQGGKNKSYTGCLIEQTVQYSLLFVISLTILSLKVSACPCSIVNYFLFSLFSSHHPHINALESTLWRTCICCFASIGQCILFLTEHQLLAIAERSEGVPVCGMVVIKKDGFINSTNGTK